MLFNVLEAKPMWWLILWLETLNSMLMITLKTFHVIPISELPFLHILISNKLILVPFVTKKLI